MSKKYITAYNVQKNGAKKRGIDFNLTFAEWIMWWRNTGHFEQRGRRKDEYVMARFNDIGPYELGNIKCILSGENVRESAPKDKSGWNHSEETKQKWRTERTGKNHPSYGRKASNETRKKQSLAKIGKKQTPESNIKRSKTQTGVRQHKIQCIYCGVIGGNRLIKRYHNENCKKKPI